MSFLTHLQHKAQLYCYSTTPCCAYPLACTPCLHPLACTRPGTKYFCTCCACMLPKPEVVCSFTVVPFVVPGPHTFL